MDQPPREGFSARPGGQAGHSILPSGKHDDLALPDAPVSLDLPGGTHRAISPIQRRHALYFAGGNYLEPQAPGVSLQVAHELVARHVAWVAPGHWEVGESR